MEKYVITGDLQQSIETEVNASKSPMEIFKDHGLKLRYGTRIIAIQVGGALGCLAMGKDMLKPISELMDDASVPYIMYFGENFCPVDYLRFLSRFLIREVRIDTDATRNLNTVIEDITIKETWDNSIDKLKKVVSMLGDTYAEVRVKALYLQVIERYYDVIEAHIDEKHCKTGICRTLILAQCINACPAQVHIPGYVSLMKKGEEVKAYELMRKTNPLSLICGKICARPCEDRCRRKEIENTVGVRALQKYISLNALNSSEFNEDKLTSNGKKVAIVGAGPAGLTAAYYLQRTGYEVSMYEAAQKAGGMLALTVPEYRMPDKDLNIEIHSILKLGVKIHYGVKVGKDISLEALRGENDYVVIAIGASSGRSLKYLENENTFVALDFLRDARLKKLSELKGDVVVLGGGDVAMDSARTAIRMGAKSVTVVSLETYDNMLAGEEEKAFAKAENINFISGYGIKERMPDGKLLLNECLATIDIEGVFNPVYSDKTMIIDADTLILAVGQYANLDMLSDDIETARGLIKVNKATKETTAKNVYAIGDATENGIAIKAIAEGKKVAESIDKAANGKGLYLGESIEIPNEPLSITTWDDDILLEKVVDAADLKGNFDELVVPFDQTSALYEANRCLRCDRNSTQPLWIRPKNNV